MNMKIITPILVVIMLVIAGLGIAYYSGEGYWEKPTAFGAFAVEVNINYKDGTTKNLKLMQENAIYRALNSLSLIPKRGGNEITSIDFTLSARATGEGYDSVTLDMSNVRFTAKADETETFSTSIFTPPKTIPVDNTFHKVLSIKLESSYNIFGQDKLNEGEHTLYLILDGEVKYKGEPDGEWQTTSNLPEPITVSYSLEEGNWVEIDFSASTKLNY